MRFSYLLILIALVFFNACREDDDLEVTGMKPVYISNDALLQFEQSGPQSIEKAGKIMLYQNYIFLGEINRGIHIIDITDTLDPVNISYLAIPGNQDIVAQDDRLYADNGPHLLTIDISDIQHITLIQRSLNVFHPSEMSPTNFSGYFECFDETKGWLVDWQESALLNPKCKNTNN